MLTQELIRPSMLEESRIKGKLTNLPPKPWNGKYEVGDTFGRMQLSITSKHSPPHGCSRGTLIITARAKSVNMSTT